MRSSTGSRPTFTAYSIVCTALSEQPPQGMVHRLVTHTTHLVPIEVHYLLLSTPASKGSVGKG